MIRFAKGIMVNGHSIACVLLAGYVFAPVMRFGFAFGRYVARGRISERGE